MTLLIDMNLSPRWADVLTASGLEAVHWSVIGAPDAPDTVIMNYARAHGYTVFTHDLDFGAILASSRAGKPSVVQIRARDVLPSAAAPLVVSAVRRVAADIETGALVTIDTKKTRVHLLPL
jgi:predicted nuclease of predicted toxin-antitoxin system